MEAPRDPNLVVLSGVPVVPQQSQRALSKFLLGKLLEQNTYDHSKIYVPVDGTGHGLGLAVVRYPTSGAVDAGIAAHNGTVLDMAHVMTVERLGASQALRAAEMQGDVGEQQPRGIAALQNV